VEGKAANTTLLYMSMVLKTEKDTAFVTGGITNEEVVLRFLISNYVSENAAVEILKRKK
jgi:hypothetical protein